MAVLVEQSHSFLLRGFAALIPKQTHKHWLPAPQLQGRDSAFVVVGVSIHKVVSSLLDNEAECARGDKSLCTVNTSCVRQVPRTRVLKCISHNLSD
jgi:hypothetical protein